VYGQLELVSRINPWYEDTFSQPSCLQRLNCGSLRPDFVDRERGGIAQDLPSCRQVLPKRHFDFTSATRCEFIELRGHLDDARITEAPSFEENSLTPLKSFSVPEPLRTHPQRDCLLPNQNFSESP